MANKEISELTVAATLGGTELAHVVQGGSSRQTTTAAIARAPQAWVDLAGGSSIDIGAVASQSVRITGSGASIAALGTAPAGTVRMLLMAASNTLVHNATSLILFGSNITAASGDVIILKSEGSGNWRCVGYSSASGVAPDVPARPKTASGAGQFTYVQTSVGGGYALPAGGTWAYQLLCFSNSTGVLAGGASGAGVAAGGASVASPSAGNIYIGFAWRVA